MDNQQIIVFTCRDAVVLNHEHDFFELAYIQQGNATHHLENNVTTLREGDYFIMDNTITTNKSGIFHWL